MKHMFFLLLLMLGWSPVRAQSDLSTGAISRPAEPDAIPLGTGDVPGMAPESWFVSNGMRSVRNVSEATLTPFLPAPENATGAAVIIAPGGAFAILAIEKEGWNVARWLASQGIAAFVLKYRVNPTPADPAEAQRQRVAAMARRSPPDLSTPPQAIQDGLAALALVRARAAEWNVDPQRVGMLGFSAGAMTTLSVTLQARPEERPAFIAPIYGPLAPVQVPAGAPPLFAAIAADDPLFGARGFGLIESWRAAGAQVEFHYHQSGGHGFGLGKQETTTVGWPAAFRLWLETNGFLTRRP